MCLVVSSWVLVPYLWVGRDPLSAVVRDGWNPAWAWSTVGPGIPAVLALCAGAAAMRSTPVLKAASVVVGVHVALCVWVALDGRTPPTATHLAGWVALALACATLATGFRVASAPPDDGRLRSWTTAALVVALVGQLVVLTVPAVVDSTGVLGDALFSAASAASTALLTSVAAWLLGRGGRHDLLAAAALVAVVAVAVLVDARGVGAAGGLGDVVLTVVRLTLLVAAALLALVARVTKCAGSTRR